MKRFIFIPIIFILSSCTSANNISSSNYNENGSSYAESNMPTSEENSSIFIPRVGEKILDNFTFKDFNGDYYNQDILKNKITLFNIWSTTCGPCIKEMPILEKLNNQYKKIQVIGIAYDTVDLNYNTEFENFFDAQEIISKYNITYLNAIPSKSFKNILDEVKTVPSSFFINENGNLLNEKISGALEEEVWDKYFSEYSKLI